MRELGFVFIVMGYGVVEVFIWDEVYSLIWSVVERRYRIIVGYGLYVVKGNVELVRGGYFAMNADGG